MIYLRELRESSTSRNFFLSSHIHITIHESLKHINKKLRKFIKRPISMGSYNFFHTHACTPLLLFGYICISHGKWN